MADLTYLQLPLAVSFKGYSDLALLPNADGTYQVAVTSQEWSPRHCGLDSPHQPATYLVLAFTR
jgi:hypothetical protein